jgi:hypothetical protein
MNSVVPIANPPIERASTESVKLVVRVPAAAGLCVVRVQPSIQPSVASASLKVGDGRITDDTFAGSGR